MVRAKRLRQATIAVCIPAHNEESTVGAVVSTVRRSLVEDHPLVDEVVVLDDRSSDGTAGVAAAAGASVVPIAEVLPEVVSAQGKGNVLWRSLHLTSSDLICWVDADIAEFRPEMVSGILAPLLHLSHLGFVKSYYARPTDGSDVGGGRVTELVPKPLIASLFPASLHIRLFPPVSELLMADHGPIRMWFPRCNQTATCFRDLAECRPIRHRTEHNHQRR
jgi:glucosyl-3-phosphoglycerate synthase